MAPPRNPADAPPRVVLVEPQFPGNVGAAARVLGNFGMAELVIVGAPGINTEREACLRATDSAAVLRDARHVTTLEEAVAGCALVVGFSARSGRHRGDPEGVDEVLARVRASRARAAVVFGTEAQGLSTADALRCDALVRIPTAAGHPSMNLSHAVAVFGYAWTVAGERRRSAPPPVDRAQRARLAQDAEALLVRAGWQTHGRSRRPWRLMQRLLARAAPSEEELRILHGVVSKLLEFGR
ncbi:MAG: hypothetical protein HY904_16200 [Deltaproteobacteria bacterium]|nr:hypothetical protein [Deltaproteobacteria bacterium]